MGRYDDAEPKLPLAIIIGIVVVIIVASIAWFYSGDEKEEGGVVSELSLPHSEQGRPESEGDLVIDGSPAEDLVDETAIQAGAMTEPVEPLPLLADSDELFRREMQALSPNFVDQLQSTELIRSYLLVINDFSQGQRLYKHMRFLQPPAAFVAEQDEQGWFIPERSYRRYDRLAKAFASLDVTAAVEAYRKLRPLLQQVYAEFAYPDQYQLEDLFKKAAAEMIAAPALEGRVALIRPTVRYHFADKKLEALSPVQKQMLRMGPENTRMIQKKMRELVQQLVKLQSE